MCQKVQAAGERLSRRALLKGLGMGAGVIVVQTLPGCGWVSERLRPERAPLAPQAQKDDLIKESVKAWKSVLRAQNKIETVSADELERRVGYAKRTMLQMLDELDAAGVTAQMDEQLRMMPEQFEYPTTVKKRYREEFASVLTGDQKEQLGEILAKPGTKKPVEKVMEAGGVSAFLRKKLAEIDQGRNSPTLAFTPLAWWPCPGGIATCMVAFGIALLVCFADASLCDEASMIALVICAIAIGGCLVD